MRYKAIAERQPSNISVPGMHGSFLKWPRKYQSVGAIRVAARR